MSESWLEFHRRAAAWRRAGDRERLRLVELYEEAMRHRETQAELQFRLMTQCRDEARRLNEPWCELFFEYWRLDTLTGSCHDFARALPLAIELTVRFNGPEGREDSLCVGILTAVLYTYAEIDPLGYRDEIEQGFAFLDARIGPRPTGERFVLDFRRADYFAVVERWTEAYDLAHQSLAMASETANTWFSAWARFLLCRICHRLGLVDEMADHAALMAEQSATMDQLKRTLADACIWLAVAQQAHGDEAAAAGSFRKGMRLLQHLDRRDEISADATAAYYESRGDWKAAAGVRDRQLADLTTKGTLHKISLAHIERCRLLAKTGDLVPSDISKAREAISRMRDSAWYLKKLDGTGVQ